MLLHDGALLYILTTCSIGLQNRLLVDYLIFQWNNFCCCLWDEMTIIMLTIYDQHYERDIIRKMLPCYVCDACMHIVHIFINSHVFVMDASSSSSFFSSAFCAHLFAITLQIVHNTIFFSVAHNWHKRQRREGKKEFALEFQSWCVLVAC